MKKQGLEILCFSQIPVNILYATLPLVFLFKNNWIIVKESCDKPAAAKSLQSCPTLYDPIDGSPPGFPVPGILQAITLEWVAISFSNAWKWEVKVKLLSCVQLFTTPWTAAYQAPPSMGFSRQEYLSGVASLDSILESRDIPLLTEVHLVKARLLPVVMYTCESWTIRKAERQRIDGFTLWSLWCLRVPWTARRSNQSILKEISPEYSLEGLMLKLIYFGHRCWSWSSSTLATLCKELTHWKRPWCWERLKVGGEGDDRGWDGWMASLTRWTWVWANSGRWWWTGRPDVLQSVGWPTFGHDWVTENNS